MGRLSPQHPLGAFSNAPENGTDPEPDLGLEDMTISELSRVYNLSLSAPPSSEQPCGRELFLPGRATVETWILVDCGPDGVRPRRIHDLPGLWDRKPTLH